MTPAPSIVAINYFFGPDDLNNRIFAPEIGRAHV